ncbi:MAG: DUF1743 domain-containing protein [Candidatus Thorarchaeota archaeon]
MTVTSIHIGMDDIDSPRGGCTTHFASLIVQKLSSLGADWQDYPNLIRLNPNIPFRTRGNGAVAIRFEIDGGEVENVLSILERMIQDYVEMDYSNTNPGVVLVQGKVPQDVDIFSQRAMWRTIPIDVGERVVERNDIQHIKWGNGRGLVGALSAVGNPLDDDHTYEFIAYRSVDSISQPRGVHKESVIEMDKQMSDSLFSNVDERTGRVLIVPHGPDPVLYGIRGEQPESVKRASSKVESDQKVDRWMIFRTNQGTGAHLRNCVYVNDLRAYMAVVVHGIVDKKPRIFEGGHVLFGIGDCSGRADCAAYEPSGEFREVVGSLVEGDQVMVQAGVRPASRTHGLTLNVEGLDVLKLAETFNVINPLCPHCLKRMKSAGKDKGYKCFNCGFKDPKAKRTETPVKRKLRETVYLPPPRAQRHLTRPLVRMNRRNQGVPDRLIAEWHRP